LNRLDNDTAGYLYFAKDKKVFERYKMQQDNHEIYKVYLCDVQGRVDVSRTVEKHPELALHEQGTGKSDQRVSASDS
jgi:23S rRNA-/tRNA-specific pseudouridylate synthase